MRAISLWQPWASLIALGLKTYETRSWAPSPAQYGPLAIHAAKRWTRDQKDDAYGIATRSRTLHAAVWGLFGMEGAFSAFNGPLGAVVAVCDLVSVHRTEDVRGA